MIDEERFRPMYSLALGINLLFVWWIMKDVNGLVTDGLIAEWVSTLFCVVCLLTVVLSAVKVYVNLKVSGLFGGVE